MRRLLIILDKIGFPNGVTHGVGTYLVQTVPALIQAGWDARVIVLGPEHPTADELRERDVTTHCLGGVKWSPKFIFDIAGIIQDWKPHVVHVHGTKSIIGSLYWGWRSNLAIVAHAHDNESSPLDRLVGYSLSRAAIVLTCSGALKTALTQRFPHLTNVLPLYYGFDYERFAKGNRDGTRRTLGLSSEHFVIGCPGRLKAYKGQRDLVKSLDALLRRRPELASRVRLVLIGDGPDRDPLTSQVEELGLNEIVLLLGNRSDMADLYAASDLIVIPSRFFEAFGLVALEAMASGRYVIAAETGGLAELVADVGTLFPPGDVIALTDAIESFLRIPEKHDSLIQACLKRSRQFSLDAHILRQIEIYNSVLS